MKNKERLSIANHLMKSYMLCFPLFLLLMILIVMVGTFLNTKWISSLTPSAEHTAQKLIQTDWNAIDCSPVVAHGGSVAIVDREGNVIPLGGKEIFPGDELSVEEWTQFLMNCSDLTEKYNYSVAYEEQGEFWLIVRFPVSVRIQLSMASNTESEMYGKAVGYFLSLAIALFLLLIVTTLIYAKLSSRVFVTPLRQLCGMVKRMVRGDYLDEGTSQKLGGEFLWLKNDISKLALSLKVEKDLREQMEKNRRQLFLDLSHDLKNPIATISLYAETLGNEEMEDREKRRCYAEIIQKNSLRANAILDDLLMFSKLEHPDFMISMRMGDICEFIREQISLFLADFEVAEIETEFTIPDKEILLPFDEKLLARVCSNLLTNTIRYNQTGAEVKLSVTEKEDSVLIILEDNGTGMDAEIAETIFQPFTRADQSRNSETGGSGLGLAIVKKIIDAHHGKIELLTSPGHGCIFLIELKRN